VAEEKLLELLLGSEELRKMILPGLESRAYENLATASVFRALVKLNAEGGKIDFDSLSEATIDDPLAAPLLARLMMAEVPESFDEALAQANSCTDALQRMSLAHDIGEMGAQISEVGRAGQDEQLGRISLEALELLKKQFESSNEK